jgi:hypothetical protein
MGSLLFRFFVAPLSGAAVVQVSRAASTISGGLEAASTAGLESGATKKRETLNN